MMNKLGMPEKGAYYARPIEAYDFQVVKEELWAGVRKIRTWGGPDGETELGHPLVFPCSLLAPQREHIVMHFRIPVDDTHTRLIWVQYTPGTDTSEMDWDSPPVEYIPSFKDEKGEYDLTSFRSQDAMAWETEGKIFDRTKEYLGVSDRGIVLYRRMLKEQILAVQGGKEPLGVIRDPEKNRSISIHVSEGQARMAHKMKQAG
jgi:5,5'-dehydrodivanillate O-demethylase